MTLFEKFSDNVKNNPEKVIWADECGEYTGECIDILSARVYAYLHSKGLGTENVIMIKLPRGIAIPVCEYGIFKAGACCVIVADWASKEQFDAVRTSIFFVAYPIFSIFTARIFLKERYTLKQYICIGAITLAAIVFCAMDYIA